MKREYTQKEFPNKIHFFNQYYKFHRNLLIWPKQTVDDLMQAYYNKLKAIDYRAVKDLLKKQQGVSITTQRSFESVDSDQTYTKKSKYSTMLNFIEVSQESEVLKDFCSKIEQNKETFYLEESVKENYWSGELQFEKYLEKE